MNENYAINKAMRHVSRLHFIGIGGSGMGGIAEVLLNQGFLVSGSDKNISAMTQRLQSLGAKIYIGHDATQVGQADAVIVSSAIAKDNPELLAAQDKLLPIVSRAEMLAELMRFKHGIAVAGTHGKTTTTSLIASILAEGELDPTFVIGGVLNSAGTHARLGTGQYFVAEADESDASFLLLKPLMAVVTNIDNDHLAAYENSFDKLKQAFLRFMHHLPFYGLVVICGDDAVINSLIGDIGRPMLTYGIDKHNDFYAYDIVFEQMVTKFKVKRKGYEQDLVIKLNITGQHNILNALAAIAVSTQLGVSATAIISALSRFQGVGRRMQLLAQLPVKLGTVALFDDYGHHPTEIKATIDAIRAAWPKQRLVMIYQPHRFSRTKSLFEHFVEVLKEVDLLFLLDVYSAGELPITGADSPALFKALRACHANVIYLPQTDELFARLDEVLLPDDILITQGAGDITNLAKKLAENSAGPLDCVVNHG